MVLVDHLMFDVDVSSKCNSNEVETITGVSGPTLLGLLGCPVLPEDPDLFL